MCLVMIIYSSLNKPKNIYDENNQPIELTDHRLDTQLLIISNHILQHKNRSTLSPCFSAKRPKGSVRIYS
jgi:hypothetical protein